MNIKIKIPSVQELYPVIRELHQFGLSSTLDITVEMDKIEDSNSIRCVTPEYNDKANKTTGYTYSEPLLSY